MLNAQCSALAPPCALNLRKAGPPRHQVAPLWRVSKFVEMGRIAVAPRGMSKFVESWTFSGTREKKPINARTYAAKLVESCRKVSHVGFFDVYREKSQKSIAFGTYFLAFFEDMTILSNFGQNQHLIYTMRAGLNEKNWLFSAVSDKKPIFIYSFYAQVRARPCRAAQST